MEVEVPKSVFAIWSIALGIICIVFGISAKKFYGIKGLNQKTTDQEVDPALGRLFFCIVGAVAILAGALYLLLAKE